MGYKKCPRCSLNYVSDTEVLCKICLEEVGQALLSKDEDEEEYDLCIECGENIIKAGEDICIHCMLAQNDDDLEGPIFDDDNEEEIDEIDLDLDEEPDKEDPDEDLDEEDSDE